MQILRYCCFAIENIWIKQKRKLARKNKIKNNKKDKKNIK